jgi:hypothetical protein
MKFDGCIKDEVGVTDGNIFWRGTPCVSYKFGKMRLFWI